MHCVYLSKRNAYALSSHSNVYVQSEFNAYALSSHSNMYVQSEFLDVTSGLRVRRSEGKHNEK
jgi:hypothetical protein